MIKNIIFLTLLLSLSGCELFNFSKPFDPWGDSSKNLCKQYGYQNCDKPAETKSCDLYGNCGNSPQGGKSCDVFGNCQ